MSEQNNNAPSTYGIRVCLEGMLRNATQNSSDYYKYSVIEFLSDCQQLATRWRAGDTKVVDEFIDFYCLTEIKIKPEELQ